MITCPNCSTNNKLQKFCGNCGSRLLADGVVLQEDEIDAPLEPQKEVIESAPNKVFLFFQRIIIWIVLFCLGLKLLFSGSYNLMAIFNYYLQVRKSYFFIISLAVLFFF